MKRNIDTIVRFSGLKSGVYEYDYHLDSSFFSTFENENLCDGTVDFKVQLEKTERTMMFTFSFSGIVKTECDRCLGEMDVPVEGEETLCVRFSDTERSDNEDVAILPEGAYQIDLAQWMYEYVAVSIPMQHVHPNDNEGNPTCDPEMLKYLNTGRTSGNNEASDPSTDEVDPRWAKLLDLK